MHIDISTPLLQHRMPRSLLAARINSAVARGWSLHEQCVRLIVDNSNEMLVIVIGHQGTSREVCYEHRVAEY